MPDFAPEAELPPLAQLLPALHAPSMTLLSSRSQLSLPLPQQQQQQHPGEGGPGAVSYDTAPHSPTAAEAAFFQELERDAALAARDVLASDDGVDELVEASGAENPRLAETQEGSEGCEHAYAALLASVLPLALDEEDGGEGDLSTQLARHGGGLEELLGLADETHHAVAELEKVRRVW